MNTQSKGGSSATLSYFSLFSSVGTLFFTKLAAISAPEIENVHDLCGSDDRVDATVAPRRKIRRFAKRLHA